ncbi:hypothetical protein [Nitrosarchaeum koreense]|uniref:Uncharacterized protein n=1 Tax=Nitrosarchaeum koreense MY1 TaxID=1001994 RepID=F9CUX3_9ARCH|nr:hypothetical protein [Nitrosarchaeum koreense]EGP94677.1 hypothetical protein MY1_1933 [Nitrosarchaeum koreense MY1]HXW03187.1 hypothetical protein [Nitrosarchaeum sp.]
MKSIPSKNKSDIQKKETTRSITYRLPSNLVHELETEAMNNKISQNVLVKQILEKYVNWDRFGNKIGMIPIPRAILDSLGAEMNGDDINEIIKSVLPIIKDSVLFMKGKYDLKRCIETLEDYMRASGMKSDHRIEGELHHFIIQHELGMNWSFFTEQLLKEIFNQFMPNKNIKFQTTKNTVIATISLGSDFNEHDY